MTLPSLVVCGLARNVGNSLRESLAAIDRICAASLNGHAVIVTNDNVDDTAHQLSAWASSTSARSVVNVDGVIRAIPSRVDRLAFVRNIYLLQISELDLQPELVIVMDLDGLNDEIAASDIEKSLLAVPENWGAIFANQNGPYYDLYALRCIGWVGSDVWREVDAETRWLNLLPVRAINRLSARRIGVILRDRAVSRIVGSRQYIISSDTPPIEVDSAFGGLGIYRREILDGAWYGSRDQTGHPVCEHTELHRQLRSLGVHLYICPSLQNHSPPEHIYIDRPRGFHHV